VGGGWLVVGLNTNYETSSIIHHNLTKIYCNIIIWRKL
jgi:hypothetical protein